MKKSESLKKKIEALEKQVMDHINEVGWKNRGEKYADLSHKQQHLKNALKYWEVREVQKYCNHHGYTDAYPFEVVRVVSDKCVEVRAMSVTQTKFPSDFSPGGFVGHYHDNRSGQEYEYKSNPENTVIRVRWSEAKRQWQSERGRHHMADKPYKFHDYNF